MIYDYLIVGAGIGGLSAGLNLAFNKKKTLILEKNSLPGGLVSTFKRGRFEFDTSIYTLYDYGDDVHVGNLQELLNKFKIDLDTKVIPFNIRLTTPNNNLVIRGEINDFLLELERLNEGSMLPLKEFMKITKEIHEAKNLLLTNSKINYDKYPNFYKYLDYDAKSGLRALKVPEDAINLFGFYWLELGSPLNKLSFIDFADFMYKLIFKKETILLNKNLDFTLKLTNRYQELGGRIYFNSHVISITKEKNYYLLKTSDNQEHKAKHLIFDVSKRYVYTNLLPGTKEINELENARSLSPNGVVVYLGLNRSASELGLKNYKYYSFSTLNSENNTKYMTSLNHDTFSAYVPNVVNPNASPKNTTILILKQTYFDEVFNTLNLNNYAKTKEEIAKNLIANFENTFKIDISEYIEEIEVATPVTFVRYTNSVNGSLYGYMAKGYDNPINRILSYPDEEQSDFTFVGAYSLFGSHVDNAFYSGYYLTEQLLKKKEN